MTVFPMKMSLCRGWVTVNVLGQYVLTGPIVAVHLFSMPASRVCTARRPLARCVLAEQMYCYVWDAKSLLGCRSTVGWVVLKSLKTPLRNIKMLPLHMPYDLVLSLC